jgi:hypothetical protein
MTNREFLYIQIPLLEIPKILLTLYNLGILDNWLQAEHEE